MKRGLLIVSLALLLGIPVSLLTLVYHLPLDSSDPAPVQPITFSHRLHTVEYGIDCLFCHRGAAVLPAAGIPPLATCQACHLHIASDRPEILKLLGHFDRQEPVAWVRVNDLPEHVYFPHMMHLRVSLSCTGCHGDVSDMERVRRNIALKMGWCLDCHRQHQASIDCWTCHI